MRISKNPQVRFGREYFSRMKHQKIYRLILLPSHFYSSGLSSGRAPGTTSWTSWTESTKLIALVGPPRTGGEGKRGLRPDMGAVPASPGDPLPRLDFLNIACSAGCAVLFSKVICTISKVVEDVLLCSSFVLVFCLFFAASFTCFLLFCSCFLLFCSVLLAFLLVVVVFGRLFFSVGSSVGFS